VRRALPETADFQREAAPQAPAPKRPMRLRIAESRCVSAWRRYPKEMLIVIGLMSALTIIVGLARETRHAPRGTAAPASPSNLQEPH
jgi:hypothetical protein